MQVPEIFCLAYSSLITRRVNTGRPKQEKGQRLRRCSSLCRSFPCSRYPLSFLVASFWFSSSLFYFQAFVMDYVKVRSTAVWPPSASWLRQVVTPTALARHEDAEQAPPNPAKARVSGLTARV
ncbi:hypothetical protein ACUNEV_21965 [Serratia sp. IR-2025]